MERRGVIAGAALASSVFASGLPAQAQTGGTGLAAPLDDVLSVQLNPDALGADGERSASQTPGRRPARRARSHAQAANGGRAWRAGLAVVSTSSSTLLREGCDPQGGDAHSGSVVASERR